MDKSVTLKELERLFEKYGKVLKSKLVKDQYTGYNVSISL